MGDVYNISEKNIFKMLSNFTENDIVVKKTNISYFHFWPYFKRLQ